MQSIRRTAILLLALTATTAQAQTRPQSQSFSFRTALPNTTFVSTLLYSPHHPGWILTSDDAASPPVFFAADLPEGNYRLTLTLSSETAPAKTTIRTQSRQLQYESIATPPAQTLVLTVNIRTPQISGAAQPVSLKKGEDTNPRWQPRLLLEINSPGSKVSPLTSLTIEPAPDLPVIYLVGDSTVTDQPGEPYNSWGQMLPRWFGPSVVIANHAESGESFSSFLAEHRWEKILSTLKQGDFVLIQMGHNDQKIKQDNYARTGYSDLATQLITQARAKGATPILVTPPERQRFKNTSPPTLPTPQDSLGDFPQALRDLAKKLDVPLIDLTPQTKLLYAHFGPPTPASPNADLLFAPKDKTHHNNYGSYEISKIIANALRDHIPQLASHLRKDLPTYDPTNPLPPEKFNLPPSPNHATSRPAGS